MKILHVAPMILDQPNGISNSVSGLANALARNGVEVGVLPSLPIQGEIAKLFTDVSILPAPVLKQLNPWNLSDSWSNVIRNRIGTQNTIYCFSAWWIYLRHIMNSKRECVSSVY
jgi:hypothetical protein